MKRLVNQFVFSAIIVSVISTVFYYAICHGLRKTTRDAIGKFNYLLVDKTLYNTIFVGPSSAHLGINPMVFDSITNHQSNSFNSAMDGIRLLEMNLILHKFVKSHGTPKNIYIAFVGTTLATDTSVWNFDQYYPYIQDMDFAPVIKHDPRLLYGRYFPPLAVTYFNDPIRSLGMIGLISGSKTKEWDELRAQKGYLRSKVVINEQKSFSDMDFRDSKDGWEILDDMMLFCQKNNIRVSFLLTPMYHVKLPPASALVVEKLKSYGLSHHIITIDFLSDTRFSSNKLYADSRHLNAEGANLLTSILAKEYYPVK